MAEKLRQTLTGLAARHNRTATIVLVTVALALVVLVSNITSVPDNIIRVVSFEPTGWIDAKTNITVKFSKVMVTRDSLNLPVTETPLVFTPPIPGLARWIETDVLRFFPDAELRPATEYKAKVESDKTWASGFKIVNYSTYTFRTPRLRVESLSNSMVREESDPDLVRIALDIVFNYPVSADELQRRLKIKGKDRAVESEPEFTLQAAAEGSENAELQMATGNVVSRRFVATTEAFQQTATDQYYIVTITKDILCKDCEVALESDFVKTIQIGAKRPLVVSGARPRSNAAGSSINIAFSENVSIEQAKQYITLDPTTAFTLEESWSTIELHGEFSPGMAVTVTVASGLRAASGSKLENEFSTRVVFSDLPPSIAFTSRAVFLPSMGNGLLEFKTVNVSSIGVEVEQIFPNNLVYYLTAGYASEEYYGGPSAVLGRTFFVKDVDVQSTLNEPLLTTVDLKSIIGDSAQGIFKVAVRDRGERWTGDSRYAMVTDIGISARLADDYLMVWANSLANSEPISGAEVSLISRNNQTLVAGKTDARGIALFENIKDRLTGFDPFVIVVKRANDMAYVRLDESLLPLSDFDVAGRPYLVRGYEAFVYTDRGVYRPGDTAHIVSIVRGVKTSLPPEFPYALIINDSRGREFTRFRLSTTGAGMSVVDLAIPDFTGSGKYTAVAEIGDELQIGQTEFQVEEFMPDRIKVVLGTPTRTCFAGDTLNVEVNGKYLFGPPAANHKVAGHITIETQDFAPAGWTEYTFTNNNRTFNKMEVDLLDTLLNDTGGHVYAYPIPKDLVTPSALKALVSATVSEAGGRGVSAYADLTIHPYRQYLGMHLNVDGYAKIGEPVTAQIVCVDADGKASSAAAVNVGFYRIVYNTLYKRDKTGIARYVSEKREEIRDSATVAVTGDGATVSFTPGDYGHYEIVATDPGSGHSTAVEFYASGWGYSPWALTNPDKIELQLDKSSYAAGENALLQVRAPFGGKLLVTIEKDKILETLTRDMAENTAEIELPVKAEYSPNVYITAAVIRGAASLEPNMPARAFGVLPLCVETNKRLEITLTAPEVIKPKSTITVDLQTNKPKSAQVTLAAVDAGILQLTDFATPDPLEFFYGKKQPRLKPYDMYALIYPRAEQAANQIRPGGDKRFAAGRKRHLNPITSRRVKPVALWSGLVQTDQTGKASVTFSVPEFNGKLVLMAVGAQEGFFGSATREVVVRDKVVLQESFPRFVSPNDVFDGLVTLFNNTGARAAITVRVKATGPVDVVSSSDTTITLENNREGSIAFRCKARPEPGNITFEIEAGAGSELATLSLELPNRPAQPLTTIYGSGTATRTNPAEFVLPGDWLKGTDQYVLRTSGMPAVSFARNIQYLLSYPYGCLEQTTSRLFPLLYFNDLVKVVEPSLFGGSGHQYFIQEGIQRLQSMYQADKSFSFWPGGRYSNNWASIYASHFLSEASRAGYYIDKKFLSDIYEHLENVAKGKRERDITDVHRIYAAYVLAQAGRLPQKVVSYLKDVDPSELPAFSRYQLAGALGLSGNVTEAMPLIPPSVQPNLFEPETGGDFSSGVRTDAILLEVLQTLATDDPSIDALAKSLMERAHIGHWYTTQDNAFALMALGKYFKRKGSLGFVGQVAVQGEDIQRIDSTGSSLTRTGLGGRKVSISVTEGDGACFYYWQASGIPVTDAAREFDRGMAVRRQYFDEDGRPLKSDSLPIGSQIVAVITIKADSKPLENVVINDLLPAGFEIENPRLKTTPRLSWIPAEGHAADYQDIRDDRLLIFTSLYANREVKFYYSLRAIAGGTFKVPPVAAECMYNPLIASSSSSGAITIVR